MIGGMARFQEAWRQCARPCDEAFLMEEFMTKYKWMGIIACVGLTFGAQSLCADVKLPSLISDGVVLQQGVKVNIWGTADPGEQVAVNLQDQHASTAADNAGHWQLKVGPLSPGGPFTLTISGRNTIVVHDVLVGEVWVCSGQSNMEMPVAPSPEGWSKGALNYQDEIATADFPTLRMFTVRRAIASKPQSDVQGNWVAAHGEAISTFSATAYFFGRNLQQVLHVPVGLIHSSWGGTVAEAWTSRGTLESDPEFESILDNGAKLLTTYPKVFDDYDRQLATWRRESEQAEATNGVVPPLPAAPKDPRTDPSLPSGLFNGMVNPLTPFTIRGVIWYQGESNADRPFQYRKLFPSMIRDWRQAWGEGDFPFLYVQIANWGVHSLKWRWPELREAQSMALSLPKTGMAVTIDIGDGSDIHPRDKQDVGYRLSLAAQAIAYGRDVVYSGPTFQSMDIEGGALRLHFQHADDGLTAKSESIISVSGFEVAGEDRKFIGADARIEGDTVVVSSGDVPHPVAVRYAWGMNPRPSIYNHAGLPASPFRTDRWDDLPPEW
jgi:sialate O-acetylesterase